MTRLVVLAAVWAELQEDRRATKRLCVGRFCREAKGGVWLEIETALAQIAV